MLVLHRAKLLASNQSVLALGVAPRQVAGTAVPVFSPFPGKGGRGIGIENLLCFIKMDFFYNLRQAQKCLPVNRIPRKKEKQHHYNLCCGMLFLMTERKVKT